MEESSEVESSTRSLFGDAFPCNMAVERSLGTSAYMGFLLLVWLGPVDNDLMGITDR